MDSDIVIVGTGSGGRNFARLTHRGRICDVGDIAAVIESYRSSARTAVEAGFAGLEIDAADGCLPHQFLSTGANMRTDDWGGSVRNRARFLLAAAAAAGAAIGRDRVGVRISPGIEEEGAEETYAYLAERLDAMRLAWLRVVDVQPGWDVPALIRRHHRGPVLLESLEPEAQAA